MRFGLFTMALVALLPLAALCQEPKEITYPSPADNSPQKAMFFAPEAKESVPLVVVTGSSEIKQRLSSQLDVVRDHASHEQIFPTLLYAMGYRLRCTSPRYALPLFAKPERYLVLLYPYIPTLGQHPVGVSFAWFDHFPYRNDSQ